MENLLSSLAAFNYNGFTHIVYAVQSNLWMLLIIVGLGANAFLQLKEEVDVTVREEQQAL